MKTLTPIFVCLLGLAPFAGFAQPVRQPSEDVDSVQVRQRQGLAPDKSLLFNGWGVTPAGSTWRSVICLCACWSLPTKSASSRCMAATINMA